MVNKQGYRIAQINSRQRPDHHYVIHTKALLLLRGLCCLFSSHLEGTQSTPHQEVGNFLDIGELVQTIFTNIKGMDSACKYGSQEALASDL